MNISPIHGDSSRDDWLEVSSKLVQESVQPICAEWLAGELFIQNKKQNKVYGVNKIQFFFKIK